MVSFVQNYYDTISICSQDRIMIVWNCIAENEYFKFEVESPSSIVSDVAAVYDSSVLVAAKNKSISQLNIICHRTILCSSKKFRSFAVGNSVHRLARENWKKNSCKSSTRGLSDRFVGYLLGNRFYRRLLQLY